MQISPKSRLLLSLALSLGIHAGVAGVLIRIQKPAKSEKPIPALIAKQPSEPIDTKKTDIPLRKLAPLKIETSKTPPIDKEKLLEQLRTEKKHLIQRTLKSLRQGEHVFLANFLLKADMLDENIKELKEGGSELIDENEIYKKYDRLLLRVKRQTDKFEKPEERIDEIHRLAHRIALRGYLKKSSSLLEVVREGTYNCSSSTAFIASIEDNLVDSKYYGITLLDPPKDPSIGKTGHVLSWHKEGKVLMQIENTDGGKPRRSPFTNGFRVPKSIFIAAYLVRNGVKPWQLPPHLSRVYFRGSDHEGFPIAGVSANKPDPPDDFIPNKYFVGDLEKAVKEAAIMMAAISISKKNTTDPGGLSLSFTPYPPNIDWCAVANDFYDPMISGKPSADGKIERLAFLTPRYSNEMNYFAAITAAYILTETGVPGFEKCIPEKEYKDFEAYANLLLEGKEKKYNNDKFKKWMANPQKAKDLLIKIYRSDTVGKDLRLHVFTILAIFFPEDLEFFKNEFLHNPDQAIKGFATFALRQMGKDKRDDAIKVMNEMLAKTNDPYIKYAIMVAFAKLGYGIEAIKHFEHTSLSLKEKITLTARTHRLHPENSASPEEINKLNQLIESETNYTIKANLIASLAANGQAEMAIKHVKQKFLPLLIDKNLTELANNKPSIHNAPIFDAQEIVLALGKIDSPEIIDLLFTVFGAHPELAPEIADGLMRQRVYSEQIIKALKAGLSEASDDLGILDHQGEQTWRRTYAALLVLLMEELKPPEIYPTPPR